MYDLIVLGGGPAGTAASITAARLGARVLLLERGRFPRHKVCGEFVSAEALDLLARLLAGSPGVRVLQEAPRIGQARVHIDARQFQVRLSPPAVSISRFELDAALWRAAEFAGAECRQQATADAVSRTGEGFAVSAAGNLFETQTVVDASGRWSNLNRATAARDPWIGLKAYFASSQPQDWTDLYFFPGGYCGIQPVGPDRLNVCAMVRADRSSTLEGVFACDPQLKSLSRRWRQLVETVATAPLVFRPPAAAAGGVLHAGDAAAFVDPFVGDGISLALRSGAAAARALQSVWSNQRSLAEAARTYRVEYEKEFVPVFRAAARVRRILSMPRALRSVVLPLFRVRGFADWIVSTTRVAG